MKEMTAINKLTVLKFRPFRLVNGKVVISSYLLWRKVITHNNRGGAVVISEDLNLVLNQPVFNHRGEQLYWLSDAGFIEHPVVDYGFMVNHVCYDCDGVPAFSHLYDKRISELSYRHLFEPLYTNVVVREFHKMTERANTKLIKQIKSNLAVTE